MVVAAMNWYTQVIKYWKRNGCCWNELVRVEEQKDQ